MKRPEFSLNELEEPRCCCNTCRITKGTIALVVIEIIGTFTGIIVYGLVRGEFVADILAGKDSPPTPPKASNETFTQQDVGNITAHEVSFIYTLNNKQLSVPAIVFSCIFIAVSVLLIFGILRAQTKWLIPRLIVQMILILLRLIFIIALLVRITAYEAKATLIGAVVMEVLGWFFFIFVSVLIIRCYLFLRLKERYQPVPVPVS